MREFLLFLHFTGLALALGTGFTNFTLGLATKDMAPPERGAFFLRAFAISMNANIGFGLLVLTGIGLVFVDGPATVMAAGGIAFKIKLGLVLLLAVFAGIINSLIAKAKREKGGPVMAKIPKMGRVILITGILIVVCAVCAFH